MHRAIVGFSMILSAMAWVGCGGEGSSEVGAGPFYYQDIKPILDAKCNTCHVEGGITPFALTNYDNAFTARSAIRIQVMDRTMPPWHAADGCTDYLGDRSLSDTQIQQIAAWVEAGAPEGDPAKEGAPIDTSESRKLSRVDLNLAMPEAYTAQTEPDDYRCFVLDWPQSASTYVTGFGASAGNKQVVHHLIAYLAQPQDVAAVDALDAQDPGPGYACFGGPGIKASWIGGWSPGVQGLDFPADTGILVDPGSKIVLQVHYNSAAAGVQSDLSSIDLKLDQTVLKLARVQPFANPQWLAGQMPIPAGQADVMHTFSFDITPVVFQGNPFIIHDSGLHMHTLGTRAKLEIQRADGSTQCLLEDPRWDFHWQGSYPFVEPKVFNPGDKLSLECHWDNSAPNAQDVNWGEGTSDEMCLGVFYVSEM